MRTTGSGVQRPHASGLGAPVIATVEEVGLVADVTDMALVADVVELEFVADVEEDS